MWIRSLGQEDSLEKEVATHFYGDMATHISSILVWRIPWTEEPSGLQSMGLTKNWTQLSIHSIAFTGRPSYLQCVPGM